MHNPWASQEGGSNGQVKRGEQVCMLAEHAIFLAKMWSCLLCHVLLPPCELGHVACYSFRAPLLLLASATTRLRVRQSSSSWPGSSSWHCSSTSQKTPQKSKQQKTLAIERECLCKSSCCMVRGCIGQEHAWVLAKAQIRKHTKRKNQNNKNFGRREEHACARTQL